MPVRIPKPLIAGCLPLAVVLLASGCQSRSGPPGHPEPEVVSTEDRRIRVRLDGSVPAFTVGVGSGCLIDDDVGRPLVEPLTQLDSSEVKPDPDDPNAIILGTMRLPGPVVRVLPDVDGALVYNDRRYRGYLVIRRNGEGFLVINVVDVESYLRGVLRGELPRSFHAETYRVQAIVSRTFALYQRYANGHQRPWDVTADTSSQVYHGMEGESRAGDRAVLSTAGLVCTWDSPQGRRIFCTYFSSTCGGMNQDVRNVKGGPAVGPLSGGVKCPYCRNAEWYAWPTQKFSKDRITNAVKPFLVRSGYTDADKFAQVDDIKIISRTEGGRAVYLRLIDKNGMVIDMRAEDFRLLIDNGRAIKSAQFDIVVEGNNVSFTNGRGYGHGVGLCQQGADGMAAQGFKAGQILEYYYPGCVLMKAY